MKVALVHMRHAGTGGTERYLNQLATHLAERGDEVTIVCRSHESPPHPAVRFRVLRRLALGSGWRMRAFARDAAAHVGSSTYDVVYGLGKTWAQDAIRLGGGCHATYLELAHDATLSRAEGLVRKGAAKHRLALAIEERAFAWPALRAVVVNSDMVAADVVRRHGTPREKIRRIYNGVDLARFHPRRKHAEGAELRRSCGFASEHTVVVFLGTGYGRKGLDLVLDAAPRVFARRKELRLLVAGYDSAQRAFEVRAAASLGERAHFLGGRRDPENVLAAADLYVLPTRYDPFANATLEALASGLPVITTAQNGASELVEEGVTGSVLATPDAELFAQALSAWTEPGRLDGAGERARAVAERHPAEHTGAESAAVLDEVARMRVSGSAESSPPH
ncbi:MAG: glycosyltransferase family 4 protein [Planctomycetota bacterium]